MSQALRLRIIEPAPLRIRAASVTVAGSAGTKEFKPWYMVNTNRKETMKINRYNAVGIAEGFIECNNKKTIIKAWQYLIDTGLAFKLQGWFGRTAIDLINEGICERKK